MKNSVHTRTKHDKRSGIPLTRPPQIAIIPCSRAGASDGAAPVGWPATAVSRPIGPVGGCGCGTGPGSWSGPGVASAAVGSGADGVDARSGTGGPLARTAPDAARRRCAVGGASRA